MIEGRVEASAHDSSGEEMAMPEMRLEESEGEDQRVEGWVPSHVAPGPRRLPNQAGSTAVAALRWVRIGVSARGSPAPVAAGGWWE